MTKRLLTGRIGHYRQRLAVWCVRQLTPYGLGDNNIPCLLGLADNKEGTFVAVRFTHEPTDTVLFQMLMSSDRARRMAASITRLADRLDEE